jgi:membrane-associated phospholipid phosphatase
VRSSEWVLLCYFGYVAAISPFFPRVSYYPLAIFIAVTILLFALARPLFDVTRDWVPIALTLLAYREMNLFTPVVRDHHLEIRWIEWDRSWLPGLQRTVESLGALGPGYLEFCYLLVYAVGPFAVAVLYFLNARELVNRVLSLYLLGTLLAYALFPYFPSDPPRVVFGGADLPHIVTPFRRLNLWIVGGYGIHSSVFPSAHVSSAFSAAWALLIYLPGRKRFGWGMLIYAVSVALATVYGRYHYAADALAGLGISLVALFFARWKPLPPGAAQSQ